MCCVGRHCRLGGSIVACHSCSYHAVPCLSLLLLPCPFVPDNSHARKRQLTYEQKEKHKLNVYKVGLDCVAQAWDAGSTLDSLCTPLCVSSWQLAALLDLLRGTHGCVTVRQGAWLTASNTTGMACGSTHVHTAEMARPQRLASSMKFIDSAASLVVVAVAVAPPAAGPEER